MTLCTLSLALNRAGPQEDTKDFAGGFVLIRKDHVSARRAITQESEWTRVFDAYMMMPFDPELSPSATVPLNPPSITALRSLIHGVQLPKSKAAKSCSLKTSIDARAVAKHRNGNLRLTLDEPANVQTLLETRDSWLPAFSHLLTIHSPTYAIIVHCVPTALDIDGYARPYDLCPDSFGSPGVDELFKTNKDFDCSELTRIHWISPKTRTTKKFSSLLCAALFFELKSSILTQFNVSTAIASVTLLVSVLMPPFAVNVQALIQPTSVAHSNQNPSSRPV
ncbi:hypothetical protein BDZ89DRAFT_1146719 [Hymenopellis radicata]|nr:hypothetical protein BDZ89DRAFT_1146719 [Hymenopellis radicata]